VHACARMVLWCGDLPRLLLRQARQVCEQAYAQAGPNVLNFIKVRSPISTGRESLLHFLGCPLREGLWAVERQGELQVLTTLPLMTMVIRVCVAFGVSWALGGLWLRAGRGVWGCAVLAIAWLSRLASAPASYTCPKFGRAVSARLVGTFYLWLLFQTNEELEGKLNPKVMEALVHTTRRADPPMAYDRCVAEHAARSNEFWWMRARSRRRSCTNKPPHRHAAMHRPRQPVLSVGASCSTAPAWSTRAPCVASFSVQCVKLVGS
jgi:hypothetical protein